MSERVTLTERLVEIPSHEDETEAGDYIESWLREHTDAAVERDSHGNVIARRGSGSPSLALVGHHDVVPPDESQVEGGEYVLFRRNGRLYGRGSADMKGAVAAALCAFRDATVEEGQLLFASFVGEEDGGVGARAAIEDGFAPDYAVVGEGSTGYSAPGVTDVAIAHKGRRASTIVAEGTAAHASEPEQGENAIYRAADAIDAVREWPAPETTVLGHDVRGSLVVTEIDGGSAWNVIPDACRVTIDERTVPDERAPLADLESMPGVRVDIEQDLPPMACADESFAELALDVATAVQRNSDVDTLESEGETIPDTGALESEDDIRADTVPEHVVKPHATDAGWLADAGTNCVVCGPAQPGEAHTEDESVSLSVLERCYHIYRGIATAFLASPSRD